MLFLFAGEKLLLGKTDEKKRDQLTHIFLCWSSPGRVSPTAALAALS
jgi:hypothetical protein